MLAAPIQLTLNSGSSGGILGFDIITLVSATILPSGHYEFLAICDGTLQVIHSNDLFESADDYAAQHVGLPTLLARAAGAKRTPAKANASRLNGAKGGRPKKEQSK